MILEYFDQVVKALKVDQCVLVIFNVDFQPFQFLKRISTVTTYKGNKPSVLKSIDNILK
jgi:hypothetical protein